MRIRSTKRCRRVSEKALSAVLPCALVLALGAAREASAATETLFDGADASRWDTGRDAGRLEREYSASEIRADGEPPSLLWRFVSRGPAFNDIFLRRGVRLPVERIRVRVRNDGPAVTFSAKVRDASGAEWTPGRTALEAGSEWRWIELPAEDWKPAPWSGDPDGRLDYPLEYVTAIAFDVTPGVEYRLRISRVEAVRPDPPVVTVRPAALPERVRAGESFRARVAFEVDRECDPGTVEVLLRNGGTVIWRRRLEVERPLRARQSQDLGEVEVAVPEFAPGGACALILRLGAAPRTDEDDGGLGEIGRVTVEARRPGRTTAAVRDHGGVPTLHVDGEPDDGMAYAAYGPSVEVFADFARAGVDLFTFSATPTEAGYGLSRAAWTAPDRYDFSQLDERALMVLQANPRARFFPRLYLHAPRWWSESHPDDVVLMDPGDGKPVRFIHEGGKPAPSWASEAWRRDTIEGLRRLIAHVEASPYADRVIGYHLASGTTEEWMMWGGNEDQWVDYSPVNVARFRTWLRDRYGTDDALRAAWRDPSASIAAARIPTKAERQRCGMGALRDPAAEGATIDFYLYNSDLVAETICGFARAVKEITRGEKVVGVFYGYLLQLCGEQRQQNAGHLALAKVLASPDIDFLTSPTSYAFRELGGEGTSHFMSLAGSVRLHGKLWFDENDIRTSLSPGQVGGWGKPADLEGDFLQQEKELANVLTGGAAQWWFDVGGNRYGDPRLMERIAELVRAAGEAVSLDRSPVDEVALVVDERSLTRLRVADPLGSFLLLGQLPALHRIGAPVGHYLVSDLPRLGGVARAGIGPAGVETRVCIFPTSFAPTAEDRAAVDAVKGNGRALVFLWAAGIYRDGAVDESGMQDLTGIHLRASREPAPLRVRLRGGHPLTEGLEGAEYGVGHATWPVVYADDPEATVLGVLADGRPGLVVKEREGWTAIHSAAPLLPAEILRRIARRAGAHIYLSTEDVVWASRELVAASVARAGRRTIRLPRPGTVRDLRSGEDLGAGVESFEADFGDRATRIFVVR